MNSNLNKWRQAASILLVAKEVSKKSNFNYKLLTVKRGSKLSTNPGVTVFPGGIMEKQADTSKEWLEILKRSGFELNKFIEINTKGDKPPIFTMENSNEIPRCISLRISAIRETFEESGILICRNFNSQETLPWSTCTIIEDIVKWQKKVYGDPKEFINLCSQYQMYPDLQSLHDWSNWYTPATIPAKFDTMFFFTAFQTIPPSFAEQNEVMQLQWATPQEYIEEKLKKSITLLVPQFYEISRLNNIYDINYLAKFSQERGRKGLQPYFPYQVGTDNGNCFILPGDDLYPDSTCLFNEEKVYLKKLPQSVVRHRIHVNLSRDTNIEILNYSPLYDHIIPS
ncbi:hypothetical protein FQA39_LY04766 [Lamprigera yunnana]|nr:hypothetical protein FQA39_LY04766 [Lamprigera yunnana]